MPVHQIDERTCSPKWTPGKGFVGCLGPCDETPAALSRTRVASGNLQRDPSLAVGFRAHPWIRGFLGHTCSVLGPLVGSPERVRAPTRGVGPWS